MLPEPYRMIRRDDFAATVKNGGRAGQKTLVVHARQRAASLRTADIIIVGGPLFGLVVSKQVGNAVVRHRIARKLRHICAELAPELDSSVQIVIRVSPAAATVSSEVLEKDFRTGLTRLKLLPCPARDEQLHAS